MKSSINRMLAWREDIRVAGQGWSFSRSPTDLISGNHYNYHQLPTIDLVITGHMLSITTPTVYVPDIGSL